MKKKTKQVVDAPQYDDFGEEITKAVKEIPKSKKDKKKKVKKTRKDPEFGWICYKCYDYKSYKHNPFINAISLNCSLCNEKLKYERYTVAGGNEKAMAECPNGHTQISVPKCLCGENMTESSNTREGLLANNPVEEEISLENRIAESEKKSWWKL
jgi:hypothetical protein